MVLIKFRSENKINETGKSEIVANIKYRGWFLNVRSMLLSYCKPYSCDVSFI